jgi:hypothetical protein
MAWEARPGCPPHHRAAVERMVNALPPSYLLPPISGELFDSLEHCNRRLRGWALAEGFDIIRQGGGTKRDTSGATDRTNNLLLLVPIKTAEF